MKFFLLFSNKHKVIPKKNYFELSFSLSRKQNSIEVDKRKMVNKEQNKRVWERKKMKLITKKKAQ